MRCNSMNATINKFFRALVHREDSTCVLARPNNHFFQKIESNEKDQFFRVKL